MKSIPCLIALLLASSSGFSSAAALARSTTLPLLIQEQDSFAAGGSVKTEPGTFDLLKPLVSSGHPQADFKALSKVPIVIYYGDNIPTEPTAMPAQDSWRVRLAMAKLWRDIVNRHGGHVTLIHLPEIGIKGNTHFPFSDLNNVQIADQVAQFLAKHLLDQCV